MVWDSAPMTSSPEGLGFENVVRSARKRQAPSLSATSSSSSYSASMSSTPIRERTTSTPKWRSSLSSPRRQKPATAVSIVFAQPEQGARLGSAIDKLPAVVVDDAASSMSESSRKRERLNSNASSYMSRTEPRSDSQLPAREGGIVARKRSRLTTDVEESPEETRDTENGQSVLGAQGSASNPVDLTESPKAMDGVVELPAPTQEAKPETVATPTPPQETALVPFPTVDPQKTVRASKSTPARSSWFGFSRSRRTSKDSSSTAQPAAGGTSTESAAADPAHVASNVVDLSTFPRTEAPVATSPPRDIPSSGKPANPMAFSPVQYSPPTQRPDSNTTSISSIDEEVPRPRFTSIEGSTPMVGPQAVVEPQDAKAAGRKPSISSLNPSTSRFTLRLPLLGRPKIPLDQAVATAQAEDIREPAPAETSQAAKATEAATTDASSSSETEVAPQVINVVPPTPDERPPDSATSGSSETRSEEAAETESKPDGAVGSRPASWWDYIGWGGHGEDPSAKPSTSIDGSPSEDTAKDSPEPPAPAAADAQPPAPVEQPSDRDLSATAQAPESQPQQNNEQNDSSGSHAQKQEAGEKAPSVFSAETAKSQGSTWYSPWAWYSSSAIASNAETPKDAAEPGSSEAPKTESEMVKEEALARDQEQPTPKSSSSPEPVVAPERVATPELANPIQSTVAENKSGWMSFFVSRAATLKAVTNEANENKDGGMEVMDIDDESDPSAAIEVPARQDVQRAAPTPKALSLLSTSPKPSSPSPPPTPKSPKKAPSAPAPKEREPKKQEPPAPPLTDSESIKRDTIRGARSPSPTPSKASKTSTPPNSAKPQAPNLVLPTWADTFHLPPRSHPPPRTPTAKSKLTGALSSIAGALFSEGTRGKGKRGKGKEREQFGTWAAPPAGQQGAEHAAEFLTFGQELPKALDVLGEQLNPYILNGGCRVAVIGVAGWSPGAVTRTLAGGLPSSSSKFVNMTVQALEQFADENGFKFKKITPMPLEGDGTIRKKVARVYNHLLDNEEWMEHLHAADVIFVASHSQGGVVSTHLIDRLIEDGHILTSRSVDTLAKTAASIAAGGAAAVPTAQAQKVCLLSLCGIHLGPLRYMKTSSLLQPYFQYVENASARELFEFQDTESKLSKNYAGALRNILDHGTKVVYIASLNDQVVPVYSGVFTAASHPRILRALYIDSDAYHSSDFLSNLLILLIRILNAGLSDRGLLAHLSEATAGTLSGVGHSTAYEEPATYSLAVKYFFMTNDGTNSDADLVINPFNAVEEQNDYEIPWLLRDMIADPKISHFFSREFAQLRDAFDDWQPKTTILREVKKKLQPITRLSTTMTHGSSSISKL